MSGENCIGRKLASRRGASITFALLLFLVCTVIGVIVLVAATAAAGRVSRLAESDARYYAVNSAAQLLREEIEGTTIRLERTMTDVYTGTSATYSVNGEERVVINIDPENCEHSYQAAMIDTSDLDILNKAAQYRILGAKLLTTSTPGTTAPSAEITAVQWGYAGPVTPTEAKDLLEGDTMTLSLSSTGDAPEELLDMAVSAFLNTRGELEIKLSYTKGETYSVTLTFVQQVLPTTPSTIGEVRSEEIKTGWVLLDTPVDVTEQVINIKSDVVKWSFAGMKVG